MPKKRLLLLGRRPPKFGINRRYHQGAILGVQSHGNSREEGRQMMELLALPAVGRMIMALGTLNLNAEKDAGYFRGDVFRHAALSHDQPRVTVLPHVT